MQTAPQLALNTMPGGCPPVGWQRASSYAREPTASDRPATTLGAAGLCDGRLAMCHCPNAGGRGRRPTCRQRAEQGHYGHHCQVPKSHGVRLDVLAPMLEPSRHAPTNLGLVPNKSKDIC
jgi:hypothetical protein